MYKFALAHFKTAAPILFEVSLNIEPFELEIHPNPLLRLMRSIIGQQLSLTAARSIFNRFEELFDKKEITPARLIKISPEKLRAAGLSYQKISYLKDLAQKVVNNELALDKFGELESKIIIEELIKIKGIGQWTAEMFLMFSLGRPDVFSFGDLGLQNAIKQTYKLKNKPTLKQMEKLSKKWAPYRTYAARILWASLTNEPK